MNMMVPLLFVCCQKAPSAKRCIETGEEEPLRVHATNTSERTKRHKVH